ncbi:hypothetical protein SAMN02910377_00264 [Pseudobutyrivibrio ruminis]|uniref:Arginase n=1 Tax=Pseudobutyrivibrio ruminis TaxID=46206 RepID=A0A1H7F7F7_9FIRM|nr:hypothetical protein [Pseudobutyrivibrio ruminis]SEK19910.1 hypothetical protein SAMN02910377_00264 [Pseudobutyrivibrio ruminis]
MKLNTTILEMTDAYLHQSFYQSNEKLNIIDCRDIEGTRCYLDDVAKEELIKRISNEPADGIHFIDSGNYHYLTLLWLSKIDVDFNLVLFDHHPDDQPPSFGMITSCGGWVLEAKETLPHLKNVYTFGVGDMPDISDIPTDLPLYISIDKDVLSTDYAITDWDQGTMTLPEMKEILEKIFSAHEIYGVDICGDSGEMAENGAPINNQTNATLFDFLSQKK